jgi:hypothetical protein
MSDHDARWLVRLRIAVTGFAVVYLVVRGPHLWHLADLARTAPAGWDPVGPFVVWDSPWSPSAVRAVLVLTVPVCVLAAAGRWWRVTGPAAAVGVLILTSFASSWGQIFHTENLLVVHLTILAVAAVIDGDRPAHRTGDLPAQAMEVAVVVAYVLAGVAKLRASGLAWLDGDALAHQVAHDNLRKALVGDWYSPIGTWALDHVWIFGPLAVLSLAVELGAPLALIGGRVRTAWVASAWLFHVGVLALMAILFPYQLFGVAFLCFWAASPLLRRHAETEPLREATASP